MTTTKFIKESVNRSPKGSLMLLGESVFDTITMNNNCTSARKVVGNAASSIKANYAIEYAISEGLGAINIEQLRVRTGKGIIEFDTNLSEIKNYNNSKVAIYLSTLCTQATDNAKDPVLYYINCTPKTSGAYSYLYLLGLDSDQIVDIMTTPFMERLISFCDGNVILGQGESNFVNVLEYLVGLKKKPNDDIKELIAELNSMGYEYSDYYAYYTIFKGANQLKFLAGTLSINQGMKNVYGEILNNNNRFEKTIEDMLNKIEGLKESEYSSYFYDENGNLIFSKDRYYNDRTYKNIVINLLDQVSVSFNPLRVLDMSPHFSAMDELIPRTITILSSLSSKYNLLNLYVTKDRHSKRSDENDKYFTEGQANMVKIFSETINTDMIAKFLHSTNFSYTYFDENNMEQLFHLSTATGVSKFIEFMNNVIFPILQKKYPENYFIKLLNLDSIYLADQKMYIYGYELGMDMNAKENADHLLEVMVDFNNIINDHITIDDIGKYSDLSEVFNKFESNKIGDYLFLYNLFIFKNKLNGKSFSKLFTDSAFRMPLIKKYFNFVGLYDLDSSGANNNITVDLDIEKLYSTKQYGSKNYEEAEYDYGDIESE